MADNQPAEVDIDNIIDRLLEGMFFLCSILTCSPWFPAWEARTLGGVRDQVLVSYRA